MLRWMFDFAKYDAIVQCHMEDELFFDSYVYSETLPCTRLEAFQIIPII